MATIAFRKWCLPLLLAISAPVLADSVSGQFALDGKPLKPNEVAAFRVADDFHPGKMSTLVMLTATAVNKAAIAKSSMPESAAINDPATQKTDFIQVFVSDDSDGLVSVNATLGGVQYADSTRMGLVASCMTKTPAHIACTIKTNGPVKLMDGKTYVFDLAFDSTVTAKTAEK